MKIEIIIDEERQAIDILYSGYNIISETIYNDKAVKKIIKILENETIDALYNIIDINKR